jgi:hypothetical protein
LERLVLSVDASGVFQNFKYHCSTVKNIYIYFCLLCSWQELPKPMEFTVFCVLIKDQTMAQHRKAQMITGLELSAPPCLQGGERPPTSNPVTRASDLISHTNCSEKCIRTPKRVLAGPHTMGVFTLKSTEMGFCAQDRNK